MQVNEACWEEYAACRLSAVFGRGRLLLYEEGLRGVLGVARGTITRRGSRNTRSSHR
jgi:hypothetical protein